MTPKEDILIALLTRIVVALEKLADLKQQEMDRG